MIDIADISLWYGEERIIKHLSLNIPKATCHGVLGSSGCGKTSLLKIILRAMSQIDTSHIIDDFKYEGFIRLSSDNKIGYVPQEPSLAPWLTVKGNILLGQNLNGTHNKKEVPSILNTVTTNLRLQQYHSHYPNQISTGTSKRVSLARAVFLNPKLYLLDEPFAGYDFDIREQAIEFLKNTIQKEGASLIIVTHDPYEVACLCSEAHIFTGSPMQHCLSVKRRKKDVLGFSAEIFEKLKLKLSRTE